MAEELDDLHDDYDDTYRGSREPHRGVLILVLGILSLILCGVLGIFAWMMGKRDLALIRSGRMDKEGEALTKVGYILGIVGTILFLLQLLLFTLYIAGMMFWMAGKK
jgi:divalent metal cation (Fe/Co/Zn/Cd) transporter